LTFDSTERPSLKNISEGGFYGVGNVRDPYFKFSDQECERVWKVHPEVKPYSLGSYRLEIWRTDFMKFRDRMDLVGNLKIVNDLDKMEGTQ
jgi:hypothetical protein